MPAFFEAGKYPIFINLYYKNFVVFDQKTIELNVKDCGTATTKITPEQENEIIIIQPTDQTGTPKENVVTSIEGASILNSPIMLPILLGNGFVIMAIAVLVVFGFVRKSKI